MTRKNYNNKQLAQDYFSVCSIGAGDRTQYRIQRKKIEECELNIFEFYNQHKNSLQELKLKGIGEKTKSMLESILRDGIKKTSKERQIDFERCFHVTMPHRKFHPDAKQDDSTWDKYTKEYEKGK